MKRTVALFLSLLLLLTALPVGTAFATGTPSFVADEVSGKPGDTVTVNLSTANNSGIVSLKVMVGYDASALKLTGISAKDFAGTSFGPLTKNPIAVNWEDAIHPNNTTDGIVAVLTFEILDTAPAGKSAITLTYDPEDVYDSDFNNVTFATSNGSVTVSGSEETDKDKFGYTVADNKVTVTSCDKALTTLTIPADVEGNAVTKIGGTAFSQCANLKSVMLPQTVTEIENGAFDGCDALKTVYFLGTTDEWNAIGYDIDPGVKVFCDKSVSGSVESLGGNIRVETDKLPAGLRFGTSFTKADFAIEGVYSTADTSDISFGVLLLPKDMLTASGFATLRELVESGADDDVLDIPAIKLYSQNDDSVKYTAVLTDIPENQWDRTICAVPYMKKDGVLFYGDPMEKSYYSVAKTALETTYSWEAINAISDPAEKAKAMEIVQKLENIVDTVESENWVSGWY